MSNTNSSLPPNITGLILAGGLSTRMGGSDKSLITLAGKPLIQYVIDALQDQVKHLYISANVNNAGQLKQFGYPVIIDTDVDKGPLGGIYACMQRAKTPYIVCASCDTPFLPINFTRTLLRHALSHNLALSYSQSKSARLSSQAPILEEHYTHSLWATSLAPMIEKQLKDNKLALKHILKSTPSSGVVFEQEQILPLFYNINSLKDLDEIRKLIAP